MFCLHCGKEVPDQSTFCLACGKPVRVEPTAGARSERHRSADGDAGDGDGWHAGRILLGLLLAAGIVWILFVSRGHTSDSTGVQQPSSVLRPFSQKLVNGETRVEPAQYRYWTFTVGHAVVSPHVTGTFHASGGIGNDIQVVLAEKGEFENWANGHQARLLYSSGKTTNGRMDVPIAEPGTYCLGFSNAFSLLSAKTISTDIELQYLTR
jgi:hypothetical protein